MANKLTVDCKAGYVQQVNGSPEGIAGFNKHHKSSHMVTLVNHRIDQWVIVRSLSEALRLLGFLIEMTKYTEEYQSLDFPASLLVPLSFRSDQITKSSK